MILDKKLQLSQLSQKDKIGTTYKIKVQVGNRTLARNQIKVVRPQRKLGPQDKQDHEHVTVKSCENKHHNLYIARQECLKVT